MRDSPSRRRSRPAAITIIAPVMPSALCGHSLSAEPAASVSDSTRCRALIDQNIAGVIEVDHEGRFRLVNRRYCEITGYSEDELLRMCFQDITHPDDLAEDVGLFHRALLDGVPYGLEKRYRRKDGGVAWVYLSVTRIDHDPPAVLAMVIDTSERHRAEEAARASEQSYRMLFNSIDAGFCVIEVLFDPASRPIDYVFLETNASFERATGLRDVRGARMRALVPGHEQHWFDIYGDVVRTGNPTRFEQVARALGRWYSVYAFPVGPAGAHRVAVLFEDITARKAAEQRRLFLGDLSEKLAAARDEATVIGTAVDALGRFLETDRCYFVEHVPAENRIAISDNYVRGATPHLPGELRALDFGSPEDWQRITGGDFVVSDVRRHPVTRDNAAAYEAIGVRSYVVQPLKREAPWTAMLVVTDSQPRQWKHDEITLVEEVVARVWPVVERIRTEQALVRAHGQLEHRVRERTRELQETISELEAYSYSISHDLRAPLRAMQTYASILATDCATEMAAEDREYLRRIMAAAERMDRLIRDVLVFSRVARGSMPMERTELGTFIAGVLESYPGLQVANGEIAVAAPLGAVRANPAALTQCVANLLGNAIKFTPPGVPPRIRIWSEAHGPRRRLFVRDNGVGIPPDAQAKIFGLFYQIDPKQDGTGVGLAVVRKAAERMGGAVGVTSRPGEGSTFWIELEAADG